MKFDDLPWLPVYGDQDYRNKRCPLEAQEQISYFQALRRFFPDLAAVALHPRNEGKRTFGQAYWQKKEGLNTGAVDVIIPVAPVPLALEIKRQDRTVSKWQPGQIQYLEDAQKLGAYACVALGWEAGLEATRAWLEKTQHSPAN